MIDPELVAKIRLLFFAEHWKIGTIATQLNLHRDTVRTALETDRFNRPKQDRTARKTSPYVDFIRQTLAQYPRLRSTRILQMIRARGYEGGSPQLRPPRGSPAPGGTGPVLTAAHVSWPARPSRLGSLRRSAHRANPPPAFLLCHYSLLLTRLGLERLLRSETGEFALRSRGCLCPVSGLAAHHPL